MLGQPPPYEMEQPYVTQNIPPQEPVYQPEPPPQADLLSIFTNKPTPTATIPVPSIFTNKPTPTAPISVPSQLQPAPQSQAETTKANYDPTIENILKSIGFDFEMSKRMQEKAKKVEPKPKEEPELTGINQTASFLGGGILDGNIKDALFTKKDGGDGRSTYDDPTRESDPQSALLEEGIVFKRKRTADSGIPGLESAAPAKREKTPEQYVPSSYTASSASATQPSHVTSSHASHAAPSQYDYGQTSQQQPGPPMYPYPPAAVAQYPGIKAPEYGYAIPQHPGYVAPAILPYASSAPYAPVTQTAASSAGNRNLTQVPVEKARSVLSDSKRNIDQERLLSRTVREDSPPRTKLYRDESPPRSKSYRDDSPQRNKLYLNESPPRSRSRDDSPKGRVYRDDSPRSRTDSSKALPVENIRVISAVGGGSSQRLVLPPKHERGGAKKIVESYEEER